MKNASQDRLAAELERLITAAHRGVLVEIHYMHNDPRRKPAERRTTRATAALRRFSAKLAAEPPTLATLGLQARLAAYWNERLGDFEGIPDETADLISSVLKLTGVRAVRVSTIEKRLGYKGKPLTS